ncbi:MAG: hypothetical protein IJ019_02705 [Alphaproteobacteria bacterium]|nr:hypothetical protein [Alphaproteobacteria bacterium]
MRKYFLLSAVAFLSASNVMADNLSSTVEVSAKIEYVTDMTCTPLNFGTIYLKSGNNVSTVDLNSFDTTGNIVNVSGASIGKCNFNPVYDDEGDVGVPNYTLPGYDEYDHNVILYSGAEEMLYVNNIRVLGDGSIYATLNIQGDVPANTYTGSFSIMVVQ